MELKVEDTDYKLTAEDRCDVCHAQAYVHVTLESGHLLFCSHHFNKYHRELLLTAKSIIDERERLSS